MDQYVTPNKKLPVTAMSEEEYANRKWRSSSTQLAKYHRLRIKYWDFPEHPAGL